MKKEKRMEKEKGKRKKVKVLNDRGQRSETVIMRRSD